MNLIKKKAGKKHLNQKKRILQIYQIINIKRMMRKLKQKKENIIIPKKIQTKEIIQKRVKKVKIVRQKNFQKPIQKIKLIYNFQMKKRNKKNKKVILKYIQRKHMMKMKNLK